MDRGEERFEGFLRGALGSLAGLAAMGLFFRAAQALSNGHGGSNGRGAASDGHAEDVIERRAREDEPATEAVGRMGYGALTGHDPDAETLHRLGQAVHWGYGVLLGGLYGAMREEAGGPDFVGGLGYGTAAWVLGDELMVPLLGLAEGPTAHPWTDHARALGAHLVYGAATSSATHALKRVM